VCSGLQLMDLNPLRWNRRRRDRMLMFVAMILVQTDHLPQLARQRVPSLILWVYLILGEYLSQDPGLVLPVRKGLEWNLLA
jgi:hypothetical protein